MMTPTNFDLNLDLIGKPMVMPSGGPNVRQPVGGAANRVTPFMPQGVEPIDPITRAICGLPSVQTQAPMQPRQLDNNMGGFSMPDIFNKDMSFLGGGGMAPSVPKGIDFGLGGQQMDFGNPMGGMNNWFSNFTPPMPMPAPAAPAPIMPMKGMFGVR
jgi:hypothetical protein